jgi:Mn-dependent DtxR family transcriptional regulator
MTTANPEGTSSTTEWTFLSNHAHVFLVIARDPEIRLRDVADKVGITERAVQRIVTDLEEGGFLTRERTGRRNRYDLHPHLPLRHPIESHRTIGDLLSLILSPEDLEKLAREKAEGTE